MEVQAVIRSTLIEIKHRIQYLTGDPEYNCVPYMPVDGVVRWNDDIKSCERYDALRDKWVNILVDYKGFSIP